MKARAISADNFLSLDFYIDAPHATVCAFIRERCPVQENDPVESDLILNRTDEVRVYEYIGSDVEGMRIYREIYPPIQPEKPNEK